MSMALNKNSLVSNDTQSSLMAVGQASPKEELGDRNSTHHHQLPLVEFVVVAKTEFSKLIPRPLLQR